MNVVIIEDEKNAQEALVNLLNLTSNEIDIIGLATNVVDAISLINSKKPDVVFLDIHIKNGTGFDVLEKLTNFKGRIVFTTAHESYAIKAFKYSAFDYLLKPINPSEIINTIKAISNEITKENKYAEMLSVIAHNEVNKTDQKIVLKTLNNQYIVTINTIIRCKSEGAYTQFYTKNKKILTSKNLKFYDELLKHHGFIRTHQSHLVNAIFVKQIHGSFIEMMDETKIPVSARKKAIVNKQLSKFLKNI